ncbi:MAG: hypothetical protein RMI56_01920 [Sulfolobales archaeon]|nr:hypothetical protein [Sulfolobales archaeon]MDW8082534.1 hypothetical protein [Sulfolobales archaeon]
MNRKIWSEVQNYENICICVKLAILRGIESMFPGIYGFLKFKSLATYGLSPDELSLNDFAAFARLLNELFNDRETLESAIRHIISGLTEKSREVTKAVLSGDERELYTTLSNLRDPALQRNCRKLLKWE